MCGALRKLYFVNASRKRLTTPVLHHHVRINGEFILVYLQYYSSHVHLVKTVSQIDTSLKYAGLPLNVEVNIVSLGQTNAHTLNPSTRAPQVRVARCV